MDCVHAACWTRGQVGDTVKNKQANVLCLKFQGIKAQANYQHAPAHM